MMRRNIPSVAHKECGSRPTFAVELMPFSYVLLSPMVRGHGGT